MSSITFFDHFTFADADGGSGFSTAWFSWPWQHKNAQLWITVHTVHSGGVKVSVFSSDDQDKTNTLVNAQDVTTAGVTTVQITDSVGPYVKVLLQESGGASGSIVTLSVRLVVKSE